jgi:CDP-4-dehydro-6-deoxyglucose reductase
MVINTYADLSEHEVYMCGPPAMIEAGREAFLARGLSEGALYCDSFEFAGD